MSLITWTEVKPLKNIKAIDDFEKKYNFSIPDGLKECILVNNGGRPSQNTLKTVDGEEFEVRVLLSYNNEDYYNVYKVIDYFVKNYSNKLLPFACDSAGNYYCIYNEKVVLWTQDTDVFAVCDSFGQFIKSLS